jgi:FkbM family methyltransferase
MLPVNNWLGKRLIFIIRKPILKRRQSLVDIEIDGLKLRLKPRGNLSDKRLLTTPDMLDGAERAFFESVLQPAAVVLDIGANIGGYGLLLVNSRSDLKLVAVEAHPGLAARLQQHIDFNQMNSRCFCMQVAASPNSQKVQLFIDEENQGQNSLLQDGQNRGEHIDVQGVTISEILSSCGIERADLLKMDIEGYEFPVLEQFFKSADKSFWPTYIQLEHEGGAGNNEAARLALLNGYREVLRTRMNVILKKV